MPQTDPSATGYALALEEARRALDEQERAVTDIRSRAGTLISAAAIATSFLGGPLLARAELGVAGWIAIVAFVAVSAATFVILWPRRPLELSLRPRRIIAAYLERPDGRTYTASAIERDLALYMDFSASQNRRQLRLLEISFRFATLMLTTEILAWVAALLHVV